MAAPNGGAFVLAASNDWVLRGATSNDLLIFTGNSNQDIMFGCSNTSNVYLAIASNGFVGVGLSNPGFRMDVAGDLNFSGTLRQGGVPYVGSQWSNTSSNVFVMGSNVGIGVSNASAALHVGSNLRVDGAVQVYNALQFTGVEFLPGLVQNNYTQIVAATSNIQGHSNLLWGSSGSNGMQFSIMSNTSNDIFQWVSGTASNEVMRLNGAGMLGLGASAPASILHLASNGSANVYVTLCNAGTGSRPATIGISNSGDIVLATASNHNLLLVTSNSERIRVTSNGFLGIGTGAPASMIHTYNGQVTMENTNYVVGASNVISFKHSTMVPQIMSYLPGNNMGDLRFYVSSNASQTLVMTLEGSNVGIGTATPTSTLHVYGKSYLSAYPGRSEITINDCWNNVGDTCYIRSDPVNTYCALHLQTLYQSDTASAGYLIKADTGNGTPFCVKIPNHFVGIGTASPGYALDVYSGNIGTSQANTNMSYSTASAYSHIFYTGGGAKLFINGSLYPGSDNSMPCGIAANRWSVVYSANGTIQTSDSSEKETEPLSYGLSNLMQVTPVMYRWKSQAALPEDDPAKHHKYYGVLADEVDKIFPELVYNQTRPYQLNYAELVPILINSVKELKAENDDLRSSLNYLIIRVQSLESAVGKAP